MFKNFRQTLFSVVHFRTPVFKQWLDSYIIKPLFGISSLTDFSLIIWMS